MTIHHHILTASALLTALALTGCSPSSDTGPGPAQGDTIRIGANLEMTGGQAAYGTGAVRGATLAVDEINAAGGVLGKQLELVALDNKSEPSESASAAQKLVDGGVVALIAPTTSSCALASVPITNSAGIPSVSSTATNPKVTVDEKTGEVIANSFRSCFIDPYQGQVMANFVADNLGLRRAAILIDNSSDYAKGLAQFFREAFTAKGGEIVTTEAYLQKDTDYNATLTKIKVQNPEFIYVPGYYQEVGLILKQARALGITVPFGGGDGWASPSLAEIAGLPALEGTYYSNLYAVEADNPVVMDFVNAYQGRYSEEPGMHAAMTYDTVKLIAQAITEAGSADPAAIRDALENLTTFSGVTGDMSFTETHDAKRAAFILTFRGGDIVLEDKISAD